MLGFQERKMAKILKLSIRAENDLQNIESFDNSESVSSICSSKSTDPNCNRSSKKEVDYDASTFRKPSYGSSSTSKSKIKAPKSIARIHLEYFRVSNQCKITFWSIVYVVLMCLIAMMLTFIWG
jgi:hypothetical protein